MTPQSKLEGGFVFSIENEHYATDADRETSYNLLLQLEKHVPLSHELLIRSGKRIPVTYSFGPIYVKILLYDTSELELKLECYDSNVGNFFANSTPKQSECVHILKNGRQVYYAESPLSLRIQGYALSEKKDFLVPVK